MPRKPTTASDRGWTILVNGRFTMIGAEGRNHLCPSLSLRSALFLHPQLASAEWPTQHVCVGQYSLRTRQFSATFAVDTSTCQLGQGWCSQRCDWLMPQICRDIDLQRSGMTATYMVGWLSVASVGLRLVSPGPAFSVIRFNARSWAGWENEMGVCGP